MDEEKTVNWKEETEEEVLTRLERLYDAQFNVYNDIHGQLVMAGWKRIPSADKRTESIMSPDGKYLFHFGLYPDDGKPSFEVETR